MCAKDVYCLRYVNSKLNLLSCNEIILMIYSSYNFVSYYRFSQLYNKPVATDRIGNIVIKTTVIINNKRQKVKSKNLHLDKEHHYNEVEQVIINKDRSYIYEADENKRKSAGDIMQQENR